MHQIKSNVFFKTAVVFLAIFCIVMIVTLQLQYNRLKEQKETQNSERSNRGCTDDFRHTL